ncbi:MAG: c-type cytochrome biogenesis protein CcmI, partial [Chloroflexi bacterium]|nr:c-type cytochrome biogenesis protein CcmI [Chloroflexota bacterium]
MTIFFVVFGVIALAAIIWPLLNRPGEAHRRESDHTSLEAREAAALTALRDLEFDQRLGKLAEEDYRELRAQLARRAVAELKAMDATRETKVAHDQELDALIEREVASLRRTWRQPAVNPGLPNGPPTPVQSEGVGKRRECPACAQSVEPNDRFCVACGAALPQACPDCGATVPANAQFCPQCGEPLAGSSAAASPKLADLLRHDPELAALFRPEASPTTAPKTTPAHSAGWSPSSKWLLAAGIAAVVWAGVVGIVYFRARATIEAQQSITTVAAADPRALAILPVDPNFTFLGHRGGLMWSSDGGVTWQPASVTGTVLALAVHPADPLRIYA